MRSASSCSCESSIAASCFGAVPFSLPDKAFTSPQNSANSENLRPGILLGSIKPCQNCSAPMTAVRHRKWTIVSAPLAIACQAKARINPGYGARHVGNQQPGEPLNCSIIQKFRRLIPRVTSRASAPLYGPVDCLSGEVFG
ncbi:hypothetical protein D3C77_422860 [compost metagenome]